ncbi:hypothetical protein [Hymenobacter canadensis]|uniref:Uncharacterized protein n=1 Tax=Hymenobacter canadensis TaxID=2999067 RepID=A0ABY7LSN7_9BACT|nr:hypothetical protein [Hymenobacter canadensis]WBA42957.1 hypothetical protein O3303_05185 [Hymenobacter canadensis]
MLKLLPRLGMLRAGLRAAALNERWLLELESSVRDALEHVAPYRLVSATPQQVQQYFQLLEAYADDLEQHPLPVRQQLAREALLLCQTLAPVVQAWAVAGRRRLAKARIRRGI